MVWVFVLRAWYSFFSSTHTHTLDRKIAHRNAKQIFNIQKCFLLYSYEFNFYLFHSLNNLFQFNGNFRNVTWNKTFRETGQMVGRTHFSVRRVLLIIILRDLLPQSHGLDAPLKWILVSVFVIQIQTPVFILYLKLQMTFENVFRMAL